MSPKVWYLFKDNHHIGPFSALEIKERFDRGEFSSNIPVWREGDQEWIPLANQSELASYVMPTEAIELPPLPPLPSEAYDLDDPYEKEGEKEAEQLYRKDYESEAPFHDADNLEQKLAGLESDLPRESVDVEAFWQVDSNFNEELNEELNEDQDTPELPEEAEPQHQTATARKSNKDDSPSSLQEKLAAVRTQLGENLSTSNSAQNTQNTYPDGDERFIKRDESVSEHYETDDPIRSNQHFDGDEGLPDFMAESSVDYLSKYADAAEPSEADLAAIHASDEYTDELSENQYETQGEYQEEYKEDEPIVQQMQELKTSAQAVETSPLNEATFLPDEYADQYEEGDGGKNAAIPSDEFEEFEEETHSASKIWIKIVAALLVVAVLGVTSSQLFFQKKKIPSLEKLSKTDARAFREVIDNGGHRFYYQFAVSDDEAMDIWFATNLTEQGLLEIRLESKDRQVFTKQKVVAEAKTEVLAYVGKFNEVRLIEGDQLVEGAYHMTGTFKVAGTKTKVIQWLKEYTPLKKFQYFKYKQEEYKIDATFYYSHKKGSQFKEAIAKHWDDIKVAKTKPLLIELQKWRTLKTLSEKVVLLFGQSIELNLKSIKETGNDFQKNYATVVAPVFQTLTLDTQSLIQDDKKLLPEQVSRLEELLDLQKAFGSDVAANLDALSSYKKLTKSIKKDLLDNAKQRQFNFASKVDLKIKDLQEQLEKVAASEN